MREYTEVQLETIHHTKFKYILKWQTSATLMNCKFERTWTKSVVYIH